MYVIEYVENANNKFGSLGYLELPTDLLRVIFALLSLQDMCNLAKVNTTPNDLIRKVHSRLKTLSEDTNTWKSLSIKYFLNEIPGYPDSPTKSDFKLHWSK